MLWLLSAKWTGVWRSYSQKNRRKSVIREINRRIGTHKHDSTIDARTSKTQLCTPQQVRNWCQWFKAIGVCINNISWEIVERRVKSCIFLSVGAEWRQKLHQSNNDNVEITEHRVTTMSLWGTLEKFFKSHRNIAFEVFTLLSRKQARIESCEKFHTTLWDPVQVCNLGTTENRWLWDIFPLNLANSDI